MNNQNIPPLLLGDMLRTGDARRLPADATDRFEGYLIGLRNDFLTQEEVLQLETLYQRGFEDE